MQTVCILFPIRMNKSVPPHNLENAAWVAVPTLLPADTLINFCEDIERVFRLNPYLKIISWRQQDSNCCEVEWENCSNEQVLRIATQIKITRLKNQIQLTYSTGIKRKSYFVVEETGRRAQLTIIDDYGDSNGQAIEQVDKSLAAWGQALKNFFGGYRYLRCIPGADRVINRWWIRLTPSGRRIIYILLVIAAIELIALLLFVFLYWLL